MITNEATEPGRFIIVQLGGQRLTHRTGCLHRSSPSLSDQPQLLQRRIRLQTRVRPKVELVQDARGGTPDGARVGNSVVRGRHTMSNGCRKSVQLRRLRCRCGVDAKLKYRHFRSSATDNTSDFSPPQWTLPVPLLVPDISCHCPNLSPGSGNFGWGTMIFTPGNACMFTLLWTNSLLTMLTLFSR